MKLHSDEQLEIQFDGDGFEVAGELSGPERRWDRATFLRRSAGIAVGASVLATSVGSASARRAAVVRRSVSARGSAIPGAGKSIGVDLSGTTEYDLDVLTGVMYVLSHTKYKLVARQAALNPSKELANIEDLVTQKVSGLLILPTTIASATRGVLEAKSAGIPAVNQFWTGKTAGDSGYIAVLETDNIYGGKILADYLMAKKPNGAKIVIVEGTPGQGFSEQFTAGIKKYLGSKWQILQIGNGNYLSSTSIDVTQQMLTAHPDADTLISYSSGMGAAVASYLYNAKRSDIYHITSDANQEFIKWMDNGWIKATRYLSAAQTGTLSTMIVRNFLEHNTRPSSFVVKQPSQMAERKDMSGHPPPLGVFNPKMRPALGLFAYQQYYAKASKI